MLGGNESRGEKFKLKSRGSKEGQRDILKSPTSDVKREGEEKETEQEKEKDIKHETIKRRRKRE